MNHPISDCETASWYVCLLCKRSITSGYIKAHLQTHRHKNRLGNIDVGDLQSSGATVTTGPIVDSSTNNNNNNNSAPEGEHPLFMMSSPSRFTSENNNNNENESVQSYRSDSRSATLTLSSNTANPKMTWLESAFSHLPTATVDDVAKSFGHSMVKMKNYYVYEHLGRDSHGELEPGGGIRYLVGQAFHGTDYLDKDHVPDLEEAKWHMQNFVQYHSLSEAQRKRQSELYSPMHTSVEFLPKTRLPMYRDAPKYYGKVAKSSIWNHLPIPTVENVDGVGYVSPEHAIRFAFASGVDVDEFTMRLERNDPGCKGKNEADKILYVRQSREADKMRKEALENLTEKEREDWKNLLLCWCVDWRDGFGPSHTKQNRNSVVAWTWTISPPDKKINDTENTFPIAIGLKKNYSAFFKVERKIVDDIAKLTENKKPMLVYSGKLRKIIPIYVSHIANLTDKPERADITSTIGCTSDYHRCFGRLVKLESPILDDKKIHQYLTLSSIRHYPKTIRWLYGWSRHLLPEGSNGTKFQSCLECRKKTCRFLLRETHDRPIGRFTDLTSHTTCLECTNWTLRKEYNHMLRSPVPKDYPTRTADNCTLPAPEGREAGLSHLGLVELTQEFIVKATKFAYFNASQPKVTKPWGKQITVEYLRTCGVRKEIAAAIFDSAHRNRRNHEEVNYNEMDRVSDFLFPAAWYAPLDFGNYMELVMHEIFLGVIKSNYELIEILLSETKKLITFKKAVQPLLEELNKLQLSWIATHPFSGKETAGTGAWVSENWLAWCRISKIVYAWIGQSEIFDEETGRDDLYRLVVVTTAMVSRIMTHGGVDESMCVQLELYIKELLSCVSELDIRIRYKKMRKNIEEEPNSEGNKKRRKKSEAWWLKSNYVSLLNIVPTIRRFGPMLNFWDGGGKGEKFIQKIKIHLPRGIPKYLSFFSNLISKLYKIIFIGILQNTLFRDFKDDDIDIDSDNEEVPVVVQEVPIEIDGEGGRDNNDTTTDSDSDSVTATSDFAESSEDDSESELEWEDDLECNYTSTAVEEEGMKKGRTIYVYKNEALLDQTIAQSKILSGIVMVDKNENTERKICRVFLLYRKPNKCGIANREVGFLDTQGEIIAGLWYAPIHVAPEGSAIVPTTFKAIQKIAKMSVVCVPNRFTDSPQLKFCATTNYWRERVRTGNFHLPGLDPNLYDKDSYYNYGEDEDVDPNHVI